MLTSPITILHVVDSLEPGGMENGVVNVARLLDPEEFQLRVCCLRSAGEFAARLPGHVTVHALDKRPGFSVGTAFRLARVMAKIKPDILHTHNLGPLIYGSLAKAFGQWPPILHGEHGVLDDEELTPRRMRQRRWLYHGCRRVHTVSESLRQHLVDLGFPATKIEAVVNGVDTQRFAPGDRAAVRRQLGIAVDGLWIGMIGRFTPFKRHALLLDAFAVLARRMNNVRLVIVGGGGAEQENVNRQARASDATARIHLAGFQNDPAPFYQAMDLLVFPSVNEGLSNAVLEAMATGVPVLCHNACGNAEVITPGEDGLIASLGSVEELVAQLEQALSAPTNLTLMGKKARAKVATKFSLAAMAEHYARLYRELAFSRRVG